MNFKIECVATGHRISGIMKWMGDEGTLDAMPLNRKLLFIGFLNSIYK